MDYKEIYDKVYACWLGKNIGGTLGAPLEGTKEINNVTWYPKLSEDGGMLENDDLDLQLVNLHALEQYGVRLDCRHIAKEWSEHVFFPFDEYGYAETAVRLGFDAPYCGCYENPFVDCMGSPIRSEIWAIISMGNPDLAAYYAYNDAVVDHAGGESINGTVFNAVLESLAFFSDNKQELISKALSYIPESSRTYKAVSEAVRLYESGAEFFDARNQLVEKYALDNFTDSPINISFTVLALLYGRDFEDGILKAVNIGYDTDCTVATLGSIYGIMYSVDYIPEKWKKPIGDKIKVSKAVRGFEAPADLDELTRKCLRLREMLELQDEQFKKGNIYKKGIFNFQHYSLGGDRFESNLNADIIYKNGAHIIPGSSLEADIEIHNNSKDPIELRGRANCPEGISVSFELDKELMPGESLITPIKICADKDIEFNNRIELIIDRYNSDDYWKSYTLPFTVLRSAKWEIDGKEKYFSGTSVKFDKESDDGIYCAKTDLYSPISREVKLICPTEHAVKVYIDGSEVINSSEKFAFMPAYHRCPKPQSAILFIEKGMHEVEVTIESDKPPLFMFTALASKNRQKAGTNYRLIDTVIG